MVLDGVYAPADGKLPHFEPLAPPAPADVSRVAARIACRIARLLERLGLGPQADPEEADSLARDQPLLAELYRASVSGRIATGPRAGRRIGTVGDRVEVENLEEEAGAASLLATAWGVSLHAEVCVPARNRLRLEQLCRYVARPPLAQERLSLLPDGRLLYRLKRRWRNGTTHVVFEPLEFIGKLAALVPPPRFNLVRYHGILAPAARWRGQVLPPPPDAENAASPRHPGCRSARRNERFRPAAGCPRKPLPVLAPRAFSPAPHQGILAPPGRPQPLPLPPDGGAQLPLAIPMIPERQRKESIRFVPRGHVPPNPDPACGRATTRGRNL